MTTATACRTRSAKGFTLVELLLVVAIIGIISAVAVPGLLRARQSGNEASAIGSVRTLSSAQATFASSCGGGGYATSLAALATAPPMGVPFIGPDLVSANVAPGKSGYLVDNVGDDVQVRDAVETCNGVSPSNTNFLVTATPIQAGTTGQRSFATNLSGAIYQDSTGALLTAPLAAGGTINILQ